MVVKWIHLSHSRGISGCKVTCGVCTLRQNVVLGVQVGHTSFSACFFMQLCRANTEHTAAGVNTFVIAKIYLICPGFGRHLINHPICLLCFPAGLRINNIRDPCPMLLESALMGASLRLFRVTPFAPQFLSMIWPPDLLLQAHYS